MPAFTDLLARLGLAPSNLTDAKDTLGETQKFAAEIGAMFATAGLDLDALRAAGPDSLKAHLDSLNCDEELATALLENENLEAQLKTANEAIAKHETERTQLTGWLAGIGFAVKPEATAEDAKAAFEKHVKQAAALELAKAGHPPVPAIVSRPATAAATTSDAQHYATYKALPEGPDKRAYFAKHGEAIIRGATA